MPGCTRKNPAKSFSAAGGADFIHTNLGPPALCFGMVGVERAARFCRIFYAEILGESEAPAPYCSLGTRHSRSGHPERSVSRYAAMISVPLVFPAQGLVANLYETQYSGEGKKSN